jgi:hypothetical protein
MMAVNLDAPQRRRGRPTSRDVVRHSATKYAYECTDLSDETADYFWRASDQRFVKVLHARGGGRVISVWLGSQLADIGHGRTQAIRALAGEKVISDLFPKTRKGER